MSAPTPPERRPDGLEDKPPLLGTWPNLYRAVLINLGVLILLFWLFGRYFG